LKQKPIDNIECPILNVEVNQYMCIHFIIGNSKLDIGNWKERILED
jgi:hypothetical protein